MADLITTQFPHYANLAIADVAGGKGHLKAALWQRGFRHVKTIDRRHHLAKHRPGQEYAFFTADSRERFSLVIGMHPDEATDHIILYAARNGVPFVVCPCCMKPSAVPFPGPRKKRTWLFHLEQLGCATHRIERRELSIGGDNTVLIGLPK